MPTVSFSDVPFAFLRIGLGVFSGEVPRLVTRPRNKNLTSRANLRTQLLMKIFSALLLSVLLAFSAPSHDASPPWAPTIFPSAELLQETALTVQTERGSGSGVVVVKENGDIFVWTAAHVVDGAASLRLVKQIQIPGRTVGFFTIEADLVGFSKAHDLAVLKPRHKLFFKSGAQFEAATFIPKLGAEVQHVGSFLGLPGAESFSKGVISYVGRVLDGNVFDQMSAPCFPGSSGGPVWSAEGKLIGLLVSGYDATFSFLVPVRRMHEWATAENHPEWLDK